MDSVTVGCALWSMLGFFALFLSSKPVTVGSVVMTAVVAATATQAVVGFLPQPSALPAGAPPPPDVVDMARMSWNYASSYLSAMKGEL